MMIASVWKRDDDDEVTCIACGEAFDRGDVWEYDKHGDRWDRTGKEFEHLCKPCHGDYCHQNRDGLEEMLVAAGAGETDRETFLRRFCELTAEDVEPNQPES